MLEVREELRTIVNEIDEKSSKFHITEQDKVNKFLDNILELKRTIKHNTGVLESLIEKLESFTWLDLPNKKEIDVVRQILNASKSLYSKDVITSYIFYNQFRSIGVAKEEIANYKASMDDFKETVYDVESVFFTLPKDNEFQALTKELEKLG